MKIEKAGTGILLALLLSTNAMALDECMSGIFEHEDKSRTGITINFKADVAYGYWWGLVPVNGSSRQGLSVWSELHGLVNNNNVAELDINMAWLNSSPGQEWSTGYGLQGRGALWFIDENHIAMDWSLIFAASGEYCEGQCNGTFVARRVTQPIRCDY